MNWREVLARKGNLPKRTYHISGDEDQLNELEQLFDFITYCCNVGHSTQIKLNIDGDGAANINIEKEEGKLLPLDENRIAQDSQGKDISFGLGD